MKIQQGRGPTFNISQDTNIKTKGVDNEEVGFFDDGEIAPVEKDETSLNLKTVKNILMWWAATVPVALFVSYAITSLLLINEPQSIDVCPP